MSDNVVGIVFLIAIFGLWAWSVTWAMGDAERRGKPGCLVGFFVGLVSWPLSLLMWVIFRPEDDRAR